MGRLRANDAIGDEIRRLLCVPELSLREIAERAGVDLEHLSRVLRGTGRRG